MNTNWSTTRRTGARTLSPNTLNNTLSLGGSGVVNTQPVGQSYPYQMAQNTGQTGAPPTGLIGSEQALQSGLNAGLASIDAGVNAAAGTLNPYIQGGGGAFDYQSALSGAMGNQAQADAYARYMQSPGQEYLRNQGEQAILRNSSATGGLGGGNVLQELQRHGIGLAAQDFANSFDRLGSLSQLGYGASGALAGLQGQGGFLGGEMAYGTGNTMAAGRTRAGELIADNLNSTTSALSNLINQQGAGQAQQIADAGGNIANLLAQYGRDQGLSEQQLMTLLGNIATGSASQVAGLPGLPGVQPTEGILGSIGDFVGGVGAAVGASDKRLKKNIQKLGELSGINIYSWEWNDEGKRIARDQATVGVIAQEVPHAAFEGTDGYLRVDYGRIL